MGGQVIASPNPSALPQDPRFLQKQNIMLQHQQQMIS